LFGDDYIGCWITDQLTKNGIPSDTIQVISAQSNPENIIGPIIRFNPDHMILLDAISGNEFGEIAVIPWNEDLSLDTYLFSAPLSKFCTFIQRECDCRITLIGVQIAAPTMSMEMTPQIKKAGNLIIDSLHELVV
jgi:hydrogenase 3 maturation protease